MLMNYLLVALYNLKRQPMFSAVKVLSLAIGLGCSILVIMHVQYARSFDRHIPNWENTYRVVTSLTLDYRMDTELTSDAAPHKMRLDYPQIEHLAMINPSSGPFTRGDHTSSNDFFFADSEFIAIFAPEFISGDSATALDKPFSLVLDESTATKYFGDEEALGQTLVMDDLSFEVTGVMRDMPKNTHLRFEMLMSIATGRQVEGESFMDNNAWNGFGGTRTYIQVPDRAAAQAINADLPAFLERNLPDDQKDYAQRTSQALSLEPLSDIYLSPRQGFGGTSNRGKIMRGLALFAGLILLTSCINFANLSFSQVRQRGKEIGIRKTMGAKQRDIVLQFLLESLLLTAAALCLALPLVWFAVPAYTALTGTDFTVGDVMANPGSAAMLAGFVLATGLVSSLFPALSLARHDPVVVIKGAAPAGAVRRLTRSGVTIVQFGFSTALILLAVAVTLQIRYLQTMDLGFDKDNLVVLPNTYSTANPVAFDAMLNELRQHPGIVAAGKANAIPPSTGELNPWRLPSWAPEQSRSVHHILADAGYREAMGLRLLSGRWFSDEFTSDFVPIPLPGPGEPFVPPELPPLMGVVITRTAAMSYGLGTPGEALDKTFRHSGGNYRVIGVVEDFRLSGALEDPLESIMMIRSTHAPILRVLLVRIDPAQAAAALAHLDAVWQKYRPDLPIDRYFFRQAYDDLIAAETRGINIAVTFASVISILISAFGLYALALHSAQQRTKEVGIRKVLGATSKKIVRLLTWEFLKPVLVACVLACAGGHYAILYYFRQFSSRVEVPASVYVVVTAGTLLVAALTVAVLCRRAANADPVKSLRYE